ncbi:hypothetical protein [Cryobacterium sp. TMS1-13-1]|uniref:hypothetical protein n=1 Tax=Cryobacterium sp. TMS1-13-1 TaxID=1259220 RepID=UPI00106A6B11|nr:hypothetical protein [Cryobacterium sp. TMS1-13-1]TFD23269.1 hypothetical protein E3T31_04695 [Cryobacterium sp. TMS1-13-1]
MRNPLRRRPLHAVVPSAVLLVSIGLLSGCMATPAPTDSSAPSAAAEPTATPPVFASDEEALAAAEATYSAYLSAGDVAGEIGSDSWNKYLAMTTGTERDGEVSSQTRLEERGRSITGSTTFDSMTVQTSSALDDGTWEVRTYVCFDITNSSMIEADGQQVADTGPQRWPMVVRFVTPQKDSQQLQISESTVWSGSNFC